MGNATNSDVSVYAFGSQITITDNIITNNFGNVLLEGLHYVTLTNNTIIGNSCYTHKDHNSGVDIQGRYVELINNTIKGHSCGGIIINPWAAEGYVSLIGNTITENSSGYFGGIHATANGPVTISNNTITGNIASDFGGIFAAGSSVTVTKNIIA